METRTSKLDNGLALTIPEAFAAQLGLAPNSPVEIRLPGSAIVIRPDKQPHVLLDDFLARITDENRHDEIDTGEAVGREIEIW